MVANAQASYVPAQTPAYAAIRSGSDQTSNSRACASHRERGVVWPRDLPYELCRGAPGRVKRDVGLRDDANAAIEPVDDDDAADLAELEQVHALGKRRGINDRDRGRRHVQPHARGPG